ncbi:hypothetical protein AGABI1DRAFT_110595 [Agaricus bisporus var. burnettii JB137-S8]|uniref:Uncharacterized protein n=1 Tax=Agaricus bisporus var. burnettii (strain JB137-S8 / ATCC MYA-4627 / FGSC 10392) TaxID=597362 RepID=K5XKR9_AGABU|nr:uncharacterized protein AGABI1DRAFT_110595 [Agaricus bisporus var. burnettii JB137-S8]EKM83992.1 hypothetical protein AGABI1DRAFT_110595 [Agaricus bisporus var. burnettii JB137-S8]
MLEQGIEVWRDNQRRLQAQSVRQVQGRRPGTQGEFVRLPRGLCRKLKCWTAMSKMLLSEAITGN